MLKRRVRRIDKEFGSCRSRWVLTSGAAERLYSIFGCAGRCSLRGRAGEVSAAADQDARVSHRHLLR